MANKQIWLLKIMVKEEAIPLVQGILSLHVNFGWEEKFEDHHTLFSVYSDEAPFLENIQREIRLHVPDAAMSLTQVPETDWQTAWRQYFTPVECGERFVILPPWLAHMEHRSRTEIIIDPKSAFGTGHHASTRLCLQAFSDALAANRINRKGWCLDLGCGTGILGLAACKMGMDAVGLDIDPIAIANARENRELNDITTMELLKGDLRKVKGEKFDLIFANILAGPLIEMAPDIITFLKKDAVMILGGVLQTQAPEVSRAYEEQGLSTPAILTEDEWCALLWD